MEIKITDNVINVTPRIKNVVSFLFSRIGDTAHLYLIGSRARGDNTSNSDWDFAISAEKPLPWNFFAVLRHEAADIAFPDEIDIVDIRRAPVWFQESIRDDLVEIKR